MRNRNGHAGWNIDEGKIACAVRLIKRQSRRYTFTVHSIGESQERTIEAIDQNFSENSHSRVGRA
jgi:hypothetical protein